MPGTKRRRDRRHLLCGGLAAAATGAAVAVLGQSKAAAADGDPLIAGESTTAGSTTTLRMSGAANQAGLTVEKTQDGPQLRLVPTAQTAGLSEPGELQITTAGPIIARLYSDDGVPYDDYLVTGTDLDQISSYQTVPPLRLVDTRTTSGRKDVYRTSPSAFDATYRLRAGAWIDLAVGFISNHVPIEAAFVNLTVVDPLKGGYLTAYPTDPRPIVSSVNFAPGQTISNAMFVGTALYEEAYVIRIWTSAPTHLVVDLSGLSVLGPRGIYTGPSANARNARNTPRRSPARRIVRARQLGNR